MKPGLVAASPPTDPVDCSVTCVMERYPVGGLIREYAVAFVKLYQYEGNQPIQTVKKVTIHTDGGCHGNPGPGGWAATLDYGSHHREISGGSPATTNNRMELQAAIEAFEALKEECEIKFYTDSIYLKNGMTTWLANWKRNGWKTKSRKPVKNEELWHRLDSLASKHKVSWHWLKGHNGHAGNERCDRLANIEMEKIEKKFTPSELNAMLKEFAENNE
jgi:ribonuclease HI